MRIVALPPDSTASSNRARMRPVLSRETGERRGEAAVKPPGVSLTGMTTRTATESPSPGEAPAIRTDDLTRTFGSFTAVDDLDLELPTGIVYGLLGPNGAGKSTALRMITTLLTPTRGRAMVLGHDVVRERHAVRSLIGVTGQYASVDETLTGSENLRLFGRLLGLGRSRARERARSCWPPSASPRPAASGSAATPAGCGVGWTWRSRSSPVPRSSFSTSPPLVWTRVRVSRCGTSSVPWWRAARRSC